MSPRPVVRGRWSVVRGPAVCLQLSSFISSLTRLLPIPRSAPFVPLRGDHSATRNPLILTLTTEDCLGPKPGRPSPISVRLPRISVPGLVPF